MPLQIPTVTACKVHFADGDVLEINALNIASNELSLTLEAANGKSYSIMLHSVKFIEWEEPVPLAQEGNLT